MMAAGKISILLKLFGWALILSKSSHAFSPSPTFRLATFSNAMISPIASSPDEASKLKAASIEYVVHESLIVVIISILVTWVYESVINVRRENMIHLVHSLLLSIL
jgi:hypothetical protein